MISNRRLLGYATLYLWPTFPKLQKTTNQQKPKSIQKTKIVWKLKRVTVRKVCRPNAPEWSPRRLHFWVPLGRRRSGRQRLSTTLQEWSERLCNWWSNLIMKQFFSLGTFQLDESENRCLCQNGNGWSSAKKRGELSIVVKHLGHLVRRREPSNREIW